MRKTADLRPRKRGAGARVNYLLRGSVSLRAVGAVPPRSPQPRCLRSLRAPRGPPHALSAEPDFLIEPLRGAGAGLEGAEPGRWRGAEPPSPGQTGVSPASQLSPGRRASAPAPGDEGLCPRGREPGRSDSSPASPISPFSLVRKVLESC